MALRRPPLSTWVLTILSLLAIVQLILLWSREPALERPTEYAFGDTLPDIGVVNDSDGAMLLSAALQNECRLVLFFHSACVWCQRLAPEWQGVSESDGVPVVWISLPDAPGSAATFIRRYRLKRPFYRLSSMQDTWRLGVVGTPIAMLIGPGLTFQGFVDTTPGTGINAEACS